MDYYKFNEKKSMFWLACVLPIVAVHKQDKVLLISGLFIILGKEKHTRLKHTNDGLRAQSLNILFPTTLYE